MTRIYDTPARARVRTLLDADGPMAAADIAAHLGVTPTSITCTLRRWREAEPHALHISGWRRIEGRGGLWGAVWSLGRGKDAPKPVPDVAARHREWRQQHAAQLKVKAAARRGKPIPPWLVGLMP